MCVLKAVRWGYFISFQSLSQKRYERNVKNSTENGNEKKKFDRLFFSPVFLTAFKFPPFCPSSFIHSFMDFLTHIYSKDRDSHNHPQHPQEMGMEGKGLFFRLMVGGKNPHIRCEEYIKSSLFCFSLVLSKQQQDGHVINNPLRIHEQESGGIFLKHVSGCYLMVLTLKIAPIMKQQALFMLLCHIFKSICYNNKENNKKNNC